MHPSVIDIVAVVFILLCGILSWRRGMADELARLAGAILTLWVALVSYASLGAWLAEHSRLPRRPADTVAFVGIAALLTVLVILPRLLLGKVVKLAIPVSIDRIGGLVAGVVRGSIYVAGVFLAMNLVPHEYLNRRFGRESAVGTLVLKAVPAVAARMGQWSATLPEEVREKVRRSGQGAAEKAREARERWSRE